MSSNSPLPLPTSLDDLDLDIIRLLKEDGRVSFAEIATQLTIPKATARYRVQRLLQSGVMKVHAQLNPAKLGNPHTIIICLNVAIAQVDAVAETLTQMPEIQFVAIITGQYNVTMDAFFGSHDELLALLEKIRRIPGILHYDSYVVMKLLKSEYQYTVN